MTAKEEAEEERQDALAALVNITHEAEDALRRVNPGLSLRLCNTAIRVRHAFRDAK